MHIHLSGLSFLIIGIYMMIWNTLWRLIAAHFAASARPFLNKTGRAMAWQS